MEARPAVDDAALGREAMAVLEANWTGSGTVPAPGLYPHQWSWDSAFVVIGLARRRPDRARDELLSLLRGQWSTGMVPHIVFHTREAYFPGPSLWRSQEHAAAPPVLTSGLTAPPLHGLALWWLYRHTGDRDFVRKAYPALVAQHDYLASARDLGGAGLAAIVHPWESGMDDSPAWDQPLHNLPAIHYGYRGVELADRHPDSDHERYVWLAMRYRDAGYSAGYLRDEHPFAVEDPMFNGIWLASCQAMAELAPLAHADPAPHLEQAGRIRRALLDRLWDGGFYARDLRAGQLIKVATVGGFGPLLDPELPAEQLRAAVELLESARFMGATGYPVPSCEIRAGQFDRTRYWRGPSWVNTNWLLRRAAAVHSLDHLAQQLTNGTLRLVRQAGFRECFDPFDGSGRGCRDFSWSAALTLDLLADTVWE
ncbi:amylo-alpha-1,6-glucosidase [Nonomuraea wenchangensis]|uniref:amylo-alpha-1,6-glucosidase n=1 Tax=Nonomuraea wenchangensis TaxID=568860 RepID=UPI0033182E9B